MKISKLKRKLLILCHICILVAASPAAGRGWRAHHCVIRPLVASVTYNTIQWHRLFTTTPCVATCLMFRGKLFEYLSIGVGVTACLYVVVIMGFPKSELHKVVEFVN